MASAKIILLNGTSSAGKTSLAKALQQILPDPYLHVTLDAFEEMMPPKRVGIDSQLVFSRMIAGMHASVTALAEAGNNLILDHVLIEGEEPKDWTSQCLAAIAPYRPLIVRVHAPLAELERRERERGDRSLGLAAWQSPRIHQTVRYDLSIDTSLVTPLEAAQLVLAAL